MDLCSTFCPYGFCFFYVFVLRILRDLRDLIRDLSFLKGVEFFGRFKGVEGVEEGCSRCVVVKGRVLTGVCGVLVYLLWL